MQFASDVNFWINLYVKFTILVYFLIYVCLFLY